MSQPQRLALTRARPFDSVNGRLLPESTLVIEGGVFKDVLPGLAKVDDAKTEDLQGRVVLPGLIDAHVHVTAVDHDVYKLTHQPPSLITAQSIGVMRDMLMRGFTTVRDAAGADFGLQEAQQRGLFEGPRLFIAGYPISQTGGHADIRPKGVQEMICACAGLGILGAIADGVPAVRKAAREQLRNGANQIKIMAGGGIASPTDPIDGTQFSVDEIKAICEEAEAANTYVMAHAYTGRAITRAVQAGVRSIEHGNLLDEATAKVMKAHGAFLVPTLATYAAIARDGERLGMPATTMEKLKSVQHAGIESIKIAKAYGVPVVFGTDLLGKMQDQQTTEYDLRSKAMSAIEVLQCATATAAKLLNQEGKLGVIAQGAHADLIVVEGDPLSDIGLLSRPETNLVNIMQAGRWVKH